MQNNTTLNNNTIINTIELMEQLATQATLQSSPTQIIAIESADISTELQNSLINQDIETLETQLNLENRIRCGSIHPGAGYEDESDQESTETPNLQNMAV